MLKNIRINLLYFATLIFCHNLALDLTPLYDLLIINYLFYFVHQSKL